MATHHTYDNVTAEELDQAKRYVMEMEWSPEDNAFIVSFPDAPDVKTHGATRVEAAEMGEDAIISWLTAMIDAGLPVPPPSPYSGSVTVEAPPPFDADRIQELRRTFNVSQRVFAEMLNVSLATVRAWEQGVRTPDGAAARLLGIAERHPETILEATSLAEHASGSSRLSTAYPPFCSSKHRIQNAEPPFATRPGILPRYRCREMAGGVCGHRGSAAIRGSASVARQRGQARGVAGQRGGAGQ